MLNEKLKVRDVAHPILPKLEPEDLSRQRAVVSLRKLLSSKMRANHHQRFKNIGAPAFIAEHGHAPETLEEIEEALFNATGYRMWSAANRAVQEMLWLSVGEPIYKDIERMEQSAAELVDSSDKKGELALSPASMSSHEVAAVDIHLQPGGYALNRNDKDIAAGALYEMGGNVFSFSVGGRKDDSKAAAVVQLIQNEFPEFRPDTILDIGCSAGASSVGYASHYPDAVVHAIDIGAGMLRYAHARAEALDVPVKFHQMDAASLSFEDESFDLMVSNNLLHEMGDEKRRLMMAECYRTLRPGGLLLFQDINTRFINDPIVQADIAWERLFNGEEFWESFGSADLIAELSKVGFAAENIKETEIAAVAGALRWYIIMATKNLEKGD